MHTVKKILLVKGTECMAEICGSFLSENEWEHGLDIEWRKEDMQSSRR